MVFSKFNISVLTLVVSMVGAQALAQDELNSEINDLQVQIIRKTPPPKPQVVKAPVAQTQKVVRYSTYAKPVVRQASAPTYKTSTVPQPVTVASQSMATPSGTTSFYDHTPRYAYYAPVQTPSTNTYATESQGGGMRNPFRRIEVVPAVAISSFDGSDISQLQPPGLGTTSNTSFGVSVLTDVDFGSNYFVAETGLSLTQIGGTVGYSAGNGVVNSTAYPEKVGLSYIGVPLDLKWIPAGEGNSSFYAKAGVTPAYLVSHSYASSTNINNEFLFGGYHLFDVMLNAGVGYDLKAYKDIHVILDLSVFQGMLPVLDNYNVYNYGFLGGIGIAYVL
jgi:Outer membrane protein beta-barrel domain